MDWSPDDRQPATEQPAHEHGQPRHEGVPDSRWQPQRWQGAFGWHDAFRIELRVQAIGFASRGWPVVPGTYPDETGWVGRSGWAHDGPVPIRPDWRSWLGTEADEVASWWSQRPYSVLVATGEVVDAVEVDAHLGRRAAAALRTLGSPVPIVSAPDGRWYFLTTGGQLAGSGLADKGLADTRRVRLHGAGSWLPMPPTLYYVRSEHGTGDCTGGYRGVAHWRVKPEVCGWQLPSADLVRDALLRGLDAEEAQAGTGTGKPALAAAAPGATEDVVSLATAGR